jgi:hypothetical protein
MPLLRKSRAALVLLACCAALTATAAPAATPRPKSVWSGPTSQGSQSSVAFKVLRRGRHGRSVARFKAVAAALSCNFGGGTPSVSLPGRAKIVGKGGRFKRTRTYRVRGTRITIKVRGRFRTRRSAYGTLRIRTKKDPSECYTDTVHWTAHSSG